MRRCDRCALTDALFSVRIGEDGVCNHCAQAAGAPSPAAAEECDLEPYRNPGGYDVLLAFSGGKDSTYTLYLLREKYGLNVLAMTLDNGFLSPQAEANMRAVTEALDVDRITVAPSFAKLRAIFRYAREDDTLPKKSLERASAICTYCIALVKSLAYQEAIRRDIPLIAFGWTPGQIHMHKQVVKLDYRMIQANFHAIRQKLLDGFGDAYAPLFPTDDFLHAHREALPSLFYPFPMGSYDEDGIRARIAGLGWVRPTDTDTNSSNCLLNGFAIDDHRRRYGFHPYALELSQLVREGALDRDEALARIDAPIDEDIARAVRERLYPQGE